MAGSVGVVVIHGMGEQQPGFSEATRGELSRRLGSAAARFVWREVYWADVLEPPETRLLAAMRTATDPSGAPIPLDWAALRKFVVHNLGDALAYHSGGAPSPVYGEVHARISRALAELGVALDDPSAPIVVIAHSLGAHMMSGYIWDRQHWRGAEPDPLRPIPTLAGFISFGCNIPLFALEFTVATPIDLPGAGVRKPDVVIAAAWLNFLDRDDVLGWPLRPLYAPDLERLRRLTAAQQDTVRRIQDREINVGGLVTSWTPLSHAAYWTDDNFTKPVAAYLATLAKALDS